MVLLASLAALALQGGSVSPQQHLLGDPIRRPTSRVWIVDHAGGADFTTVQPAVDAAAPGDLVVVRSVGSSHSYAGFTLEGKGLSMVGVGSSTLIAPITFAASVVMHDIPAEHFVSIRNLAFRADARDVHGVLWLEDCRAEFGGLLAPPLALRRANECVAVRCVTNASTFRIVARHAAADLVDSSLHLFESTLQGSRGKSCTASGDLHGGDGVLARDSFLLAFDSQLEGGQAGTYWDPLIGCRPGQDGLAYRATNVTAYQLDTSFVGGVSGAITTFLGVPRSLRGPALVEEGDPLHLTITGPPGDTVVTLLAPRPEVVFAPTLYGTRLVGETPAVAIQGTMPASGVLEVDLALPPLAPGSELATWVVQSLQIDPQNSYLSSGTLVHVVRAGIL